MPFKLQHNASEIDTLDTELRPTGGEGPMFSIWFTFSIKQLKRWLHPVLCNTVSVASCKCVKCWGWGSFPSHLQLVVWEYAERRSRPTAAYLLWSKQTGARAAARRCPPGAWPGDQHSVWQKHKHSGPPSPQGRTAAKSTAHNTYWHRHTTVLLSQQQFVSETSILGSRNLTLLIFWFVAMC